MKNKIIIFAIAMLLPNLAWACAGGGSYIGGILQPLFLWIATACCDVFFIGLIILNIFLAFKKDQENKRSNWWMVIVSVFLVINLVILYIHQSSVAIISFIVLFITNIILAFKANKESKRLNWWMVLATVLFVCSLFVIVFIKAQQAMLCGVSTDF